MKTALFRILRSLVLGATTLGCWVSSTSGAGSFKRITIDGSFADWTGVPLAYEDPADSPTSADYRRIWIANDEQFLYVRFTLERAEDPFTANDNLFVDADQDSTTGFGILVGSEMLVQGGAGYQERNGGFNEGGIDGLDWQGAPTGAGTEFEFRISRTARFAVDASPVFVNPQIALLLEAEDSNFTRKETAPDSEGLLYEFAEPPSPFAGRTVLVPLAGTWRYGTTGTEPGDAWRQPEFDDLAGGWSGGPALFGYTPDPGAYPLALGTALAPSVKTAYLRTHFAWNHDPAGVLFVATNVLSDGAAFYLNGAEARRIRLPAGDLAPTTPATGGPAATGGFEIFAFPPAALVLGDNVLAVEVHQSANSPDDLVFGASLAATTAFPVTLPDPAQPADRAVVAGEPTTFAVDVVATGPLTYQWLRDGTPIDGATEASLSIPSVLASHAGAYAVRVANPITPAGVTSRPAVLTVLNTPVAITGAPSAQQVVEGQSARFTVVATGSAPLLYRWFKDSQPIAGATNDTFVLEATRLEDAGQYSVEVSNPTPSSQRSSPVALTVVRDTSPPSLVGVSGGPNRVTLTFSEPLDPADAANATHFTLGGGLTAVTATANPDDPAVVVLSTTRQTLGTRYEITVAGVRDRFGNAVPAGTRRAFVSTIQIDGSFDDWDGVPQVVDDPEDAENATDYAAAWMTNDADSLYLRVRLHRPSDLAIFYNNLFVDGDNNVETGFRFRTLGSEMLIQGGGGYQQKGGGFNEGPIDGLGWQIQPEGIASEFELRISRRATFASDGLPVFPGESLALFLESENTSFQTVDVAPDTDPVVYTFLATPPADLGVLSVERSGAGLRLLWQSAGRLQSAGQIAGPWQDVAGAASPYAIGAASGTARFFRLTQ